MATEKWQIESWLGRERAAESDYMLVVCDTFDYEDYPVFVSKGDLQEALEQYSKNMQRVIEVYDLSLDIATQLKETRAWHTKEWER